MFAMLSVRNLQARHAAIGPVWVTPVELLNPTQLVSWVGLSLSLSILDKIFLLSIYQWKVPTWRIRVSRLCKWRHC